MLATLRHLASRVGPWPRRLVAIACLALAAVTAVDAQRPTSSKRLPAGATVRVYVAARDLPVGRLLTRRDVEGRSWPSGFVPPGAFRVAGADRPFGRRLAGPVARGEPVTPHRLLGPDLTAALPAGQVAAAVAVADPHVVELVHPADRVDVLAGPDQDTTADTSSSRGVTVVVEAARVLAVLGTGGTSSGTGAEVVIATDRSGATRLAGVSSSAVVTIVARSP